MSPDPLLEAAGSLRPFYETVDWTATPVGALEDWSPALRTAADLMLHSRFPITLLWGPELTLIYNEAYVELIADKHPAALGRRTQDVFPEAWEQIGPMLRGVLAGEEATWVEDASLPLFRQGRLEEAYFTFSYSPVRNERGVIEGVIDISTETTSQIVDRRRLLLLNEMRELLAGIDATDTIVELALELLRAHPADLPEVDVVPAGTGGRAVELPVGRDRCLSITPSAHLAYDDRYRAFLELLASTLTQALDRIGSREADRRMSETLQRSLLTQPPQTDQVAIAVRYLPAAQEAQVGGDWYDAFPLTDGSLAVVVGDVAGHDRLAAAAMAQVRSQLRGVAITSGGAPGSILSALDQLMQTLRSRVLATAVLARIGQDGMLRWSNAGHPPPVLVDPAGVPTLLETTPNVLLGVDVLPRGDHFRRLVEGATLVLYTDGLVERRGASVQRGFEWLVEQLHGSHAEDPETICDRLLAAVDHSIEDDVALLVLRVREQSGRGRHGSSDAPSG